MTFRRIYDGHPDHDAAGDQSLQSFRSAELNGSRPWLSSGQGIAAMEDLSKQTLPKGFSHEWIGLALEELSSGRPIFALAWHSGGLSHCRRNTKAALSFMLCWPCPWRC
jgi:hypothetical protein